MATLNTLRTRFGVVLSAVIAFALLAFIFSLKSEMGFSGNDPVVAQIDGHDVTMSEYSKEYNKILRQSGDTQMDEAQANLIYSATWQSLISEFALRPGFQSMGVEVGTPERMAIISGEIPTQVMYSAFMDQSTGVYNVNAVNNFLLSFDGNPEQEAVWNMLSEQSTIERQGNKYMALVMAGVNTNSLEVASGVDAANKSFSGRWARKGYTSIADSLIDVSANEIRDYYNQNKSAYKRQPSRTLSYVSFNVTPSASDLAAVETAVNEVGVGFSAASDIRAFIRENRNGSIADNYVPAAALVADEAEVLATGETYGPVKSDDTWRVSRVFSSIDAPDTLRIRHIVLPYTSKDLADSLLVVLRNGGDFSRTAAAYSVYSQTAQTGGELGAIPFSAFSEEFATALAPAKVNEIVKIESGDMIQLMQVYGVGKRSAHYKIASIEVPILPSDETRRATHTAASEFVIAAKGGVDKFTAAATEAEVAPRSADINPSTRNIASIGGSQEVARWAHRAKVGDLSEIFKVDDGYAVAVLVAIDESEYLSISSVEATIRRDIANKKKFEILKSELKGSTFDEIAANMDGTTGDFTDVNFGSYYAAGLGLEPRIIGAISTTEAEGTLSAPTQGLLGLYIFEVNNIAESQEPQSAEAEEVRAVSMQQNIFQQSLFGVMESLANIKDMRGSNL